MVKDKSNEDRKRTSYLRAIAGAYLLYLVYGLLEDYKNGVSGNEVLILGAIFIFSTAGVLLIYSSLRYLYIHRGSLSSESSDSNEED